MLKAAMSAVLVELRSEETPDKMLQKAIKPNPQLKAQYLR